MSSLSLDRLQTTDYILHVSLPIHQFYKTASKVITLSFLAQRIPSIPTPNVITYSANTQSSPPSRIHPLPKLHGQDGEDDEGDEDAKEQLEQLEAYQCLRTTAEAIFPAYEPLATVIISPHNVAAKNLLLDVQHL